MAVYDLIAPITVLPVTAFEVSEPGCETMKERKPRRIKQVLSSSQRARLRRQRKAIAAELPDLIARDRLSKEAADEPTLSGELRRAIHASPLSLAELAAGARIPQRALDEFLTGERTLRSDVLDRLATSLGLSWIARAGG